MNRLTRSTLHVCALLVLSLSILQPTLAQMPSTDWSAFSQLRASPVPNRYIVVLKTGETAPVEEIVNEYRGSLPRVFPHVRGFAATINRVNAARLMNDPRVAIVEQDVAVHAFWTCPPALQWFCGGTSSSSSSSVASSVASSFASSSVASSIASSVASSVAASSSVASSLASSSIASSTASSIASSVASSVASSFASSSIASSVASSIANSSVASSSSFASSSPGVLSPPLVLPTGIRRAGVGVSVTAHIDGQDDRVNADIAIIDSGTQATHPDLHVVHQVNFTNESSPDDNNGHGTHVGGIAAALDHGSDAVGMAPGARLWSVKVLDTFGSGYMSDIIAGVDYVTAHADEIEVANMSLGCQCQSSALNAAISRSVAAGVVYVVAAGNSGRDTRRFSPANHPDVMTVSALADFNGLPGGGAPATCRSDKDDTLADFSNYGRDVDIAASGVCIFSTWKGSSYNTISGTSMASPHVAGAVALYLATHPKPTNAQGVAAVAQALIDAAWPQNGANGFTGDRDWYQEPVLNVESF